MITILYEQGATSVRDAQIQNEELWLTDESLETATGWSMKPEGLCKGPICVPIPTTDADRYHKDNRTNITAFWSRLDKPIAHSDAKDVWALGESAAQRGEALASLQAPDFSLPDIDGAVHRLSDFRGRKVLLATWASW